MKKTILFFVLMSQTPFVLADTTPCGGGTQAGDVCEIAVLEPHPTQLSVGMLEVTQKTTEIEGMGKKELKKFLSKHTSRLLHAISSLARARTVYQHPRLLSELVQ